MIHFDPHAAKIVTEFVLARIISAAIGPVSDSLPIMCTLISKGLMSFCFHYRGVENNPPLNEGRLFSHEI